MSGNSLRAIFFGCAIIASSFVPSGELNGQTAKPASAVAAKAQKFYRTELYFGRSKPSGGLVSDADWNEFLAEVVTPRFPDGFTNVKAVGHYRERSGKIISEPSEVLIFFYSSAAKSISRAKIEEIRTAYVKKFEQESVLRIDLPRSVKASF